MIFFETRDMARAFASKNANWTVVDCAERPSVNGTRWAVKVL